MNQFFNIFQLRVKLPVAAFCSIFQKYLNLLIINYNNGKAYGTFIFNLFRFEAIVIAWLCYSSFLQLGSNRKVKIYVFLCIIEFHRYFPLLNFPIEIELPAQSKYVTTPMTLLCDQLLSFRSSSFSGPKSSSISLDILRVICFLLDSVIF